MRKLVVLLALVGACGDDVTVIYSDLAGVDAVARVDAGVDAATADLTNPPDLTWTDLAGGVDIAEAPDMSQPPDLRACGGPGEPCCAQPSPCDQAKANTFGWFGSVCNAGVCTHCGGIAGNPMGPGNGELCCEAPNRCIPNIGVSCKATADGERCTG